MPRGRLLSQSISYSERIESLSEWAQLLFDRIVIHADDFGRLEAKPAVLKAKTKPLSPRPLEDFAQAVAQLADAGALVLYAADGKPFLAVVKHDEHQTGLNKRTRSRYPDPNESNTITAARYLAGLSGGFPEIPADSPRREEKGTEEKGTEGAVETGPGFDVATSFEAIFARYPLRTDRALAQQLYGASVRSAEDHARCDVALTNYIDYAKAQGQSWQRAGRWFEEWQAWENVEPTARKEDKRDRNRGSERKAEDDARAVRLGFRALSIDDLDAPASDVPPVRNASRR